MEEFRVVCHSDREWQESESEKMKKGKNWRNSLAQWFATVTRKWKWKNEKGQKLKEFNGTVVCHSDGKYQESESKKIKG